jgi:hypothetical protein
MPWTYAVSAANWAGVNGGASAPINSVGSTLAVLGVTFGAGGATAITVTGGGAWTLLGAPTISGNVTHLYVNLTPPQDPAFGVTIAGTDCRMSACLAVFTGLTPVVGVVPQATATATGVALPPVLLDADTSLYVWVAQHQSTSVGVNSPGATSSALGVSSYVAGQTQGLTAGFFKGYAGSVAATLLSSPTVTAPMGAIGVVIGVASAASGGPRPGVGPIANLRGKVTATHALDISTTAALAMDTRTAHLDGTTAYTDAILIPAPAAQEQVIVTGLTASVLVAGPFSVTYRTGPDRVLGPIWLPFSGAAALTSGRTFDTGPISRALPPGQGLTVTTSGAAPQSFDAEYQIVSAG